MKSLKVLVTGGLGFIGSSLALRCTNMGASVFVLDNLQPDLGGNKHNLPSEFIEKNWINADISTPNLWEKLDQDFDIIFHCSSQTSHVDSMIDPFLDMQINVGGAINVALLAKAHKKKPNVVFAGTRAQLGKPSSYPVREDTIGEHTDVYGINKDCAEHILKLYAEKEGFKFTSLVLTNCYGERHQMKHPKFGVLNWFIKLAMNDDTIQIYGDGLQKREYLYVDDGVDTFIRAVNAPNNINRYIVGSPTKVSIKEAAETIIRVAGKGKLKLVPWPDDRKAIESGDWETDYSKIEKELQWKPSVNFEEGIKKTISFYQKNKEFYF